MIPAFSRLARRFAPALLLVGCARASRVPASYAAHPHLASYRVALPIAARPPAGDSITESWREVGQHTVHVDQLAAFGRSRGTVVLLHGGGGNGRLLMTFARPLAQAGWDVIAPDLPGFGLTGPHDGKGITVAVWTQIARTLAQELRERDDRPLFLVGMSVGSYVAYNAVATGAPVDGIIVTMLPNPAEGRVRRAMAGSWFMAHVLAPLGAITSPITDRWAFPLRRLVPLEAMTSDTAIVAALRDDPLIGARTVRLGLLRSFLGVRLAIDPTAFAQVPVLVVHPGADRWMPLALTQPTFARLCAPKQLVVLDGAAHFPVEPASWPLLTASITAFLDDPAAVTSRDC